MKCACTVRLPSRDIGLTVNAWPFVHIYFNVYMFFFCLISSSFFLSLFLFYASLCKGKPANSLLIPVKIIYCFGRKIVYVAVTGGEVSHFDGNLDFLPV